MYLPSQVLRLAAITTIFVVLIGAFPSCNRRARVADEPSTTADAANSSGVPRLAVDEPQFDFARWARAVRGHSIDEWMRGRTGIHARAQLRTTGRR